jgi:hypothetical protein
VVLVLALVAAFAAAGVSVVPAEAHAVEIPLSLREIFAEVAERIRNKEVTREIFKGLPQASKDIYEKGVADYEWFANEYGGIHPEDVVNEFETFGQDLGGAGDASIEDIYKSLEHGAGDWVDGSSTAAEAGGQLADIATQLGLAEPAALAGTTAVIPVLGLTAAVGVVWWKDGEMLNEIFSGETEQSRSEPTFSLGAAVEGEAWVKVKRCEAIGLGFAEWQEIIEKCPLKGESPGRFAGYPVLQPTGHACGSCSTQDTPHDRQERWLLLTKSSVGGETAWYTGAVGFKPEKDSAHGWPWGDPTVESAETGCEEVGSYMWIKSHRGRGGYSFSDYVAGTPVHFLKTVTSMHASGGEVYECEAYETILIFPYEVFSGTMLGVTAEMTWQVRGNRHLPRNLPKKGAACPTGHECSSLEAKKLPTTQAGLESNLNGLGETYPEGEKWLRHYEPGPEKPALPGISKVPDCAGKSVPYCEGAIRAVGLVPEVEELTWHTADLTKPGGAIVETKPAKDAEEPEGNKVGIVVNPATMPLVIPQPLPNELGSTYTTHLDTEGLTDHEIKELPETEIDPRTGASDVARTSPSSGTRVDPALGGSTLVTVDVNPSTSAGVGSGGGGLFSPPAVPSVRFPSLATPCNVFPFGLPCWLVGQLESLVATPEAPHFAITTPMGEIVVDLTSVFGVSLSGLMEAVRPILLFVSFIGLMFWLAGMAMGGSTGGGGGGDSSSGEGEGEG